MARTTTRRVDHLPTRPVAEIDNPQSFVIYGRSGSGKTTLASTWPTPILYLDIKDRGTDSIRDVEGIEVMEVEVLEDFEDVYYYLKANKDHGYKTVVHDTVTQLQQLVMRSVLEKKKKSTRNIGAWGTMTKQDWGEVAGIIKGWVDDFRDLDINNVFLAQERADKPDDDFEDNILVPEVGPRTMPSVAAAMNAAVNVIGNTFIRLKSRKVEVRGRKKILEEAVYCLRVGPNPVYATKIRKPRRLLAPDYIEDPTYDDIMDIIEGKV